MQEIVCGALVRGGRVLLVHRSPDRRAFPNVWDLPGGHIEAGEAELAALAREMHEELGVQVATGSATHLCRLDIGRGEESVSLSAWLVDEWEGTPTNAAPEEHDDMRWFRPEELPPVAHELLGTAILEAMPGARPTVWIFHGKHARYASGVFETSDAALAWAAENRVTGILTEYLFGGAYDAAVRQGRFRPSKPHHGTAEHVAGFSPGLRHIHLTEGSQG
jgi:mutator protein MutT